MKTLKEFIKENFDKPRVRLGKGGMRITLDPATVAKNRSPKTIKGRDLKPGDHVRHGYNWDRTSVVLSSKPKPGGPDKYGNTHDVTIHSVGRIFAKPAKYYSSRRDNDEMYVSPKRLTKSKTISMGEHPKHGWIHRGGMGSDEKPHSYTQVAVEPREPNYTNFYK